MTDSANPYVTGSQTGHCGHRSGRHARTSLSAQPTSVTHGVAFAVTVTALDAYGNIATGYLGTIHFTTGDHKAVLPSDYTFVAADAGVHTFMVTFNSTGTQTLTATDTRPVRSRGVLR